MAKYIRKLPRMNNPDTGEPFVTRHEYSVYLATHKINPDTGKLFSSHTEYQQYHATHRINPDTGRRFASITEYQKYMMQKNKKDKPQRARLSKLITIGLEALGENQNWLARQAEVPRQRISDYVNMRCLPKPEVQKRIFRALELPYKSIEEFIKDN